MSDLFYQELEGRLASMRPGDKLYKILKQRLTPMGYWRVKPRGKPFGAGVDPRRKPENNPKP